MRFRGPQALNDTYKKQGGHPSTFRRLGVPTRQPLFFQTLRDSLTEEAKRISFSFNHLCTLSLAAEGMPPVFPIWELIPLPIPAPLCPLFSIAYEMQISQALYFQIHPCNGGVPVGVPAPHLPARRRANVRRYPYLVLTPLPPYLITSSVSPSVPLQQKALGATISKVARILHDPGKQLRSSRCLRIVSGHRGQFFLGPLCKSCLRPAF